MLHSKNQFDILIHVSFKHILETYDSILGLNMVQSITLIEHLNTIELLTSPTYTDLDNCLSLIS